MKKFDLELSVGLFVLVGIVSLAYLSINLGGLDIMERDRITLYATFEKAGGVKSGAVVEIAGVQVGKVAEIILNEDYQALVTLLIDRDVPIQEDAIASIKTKGLIGEKYVQITPGGFDEILGDGQSIRETESAIDLEELISKYVFGGV